MPRRDGSGPMGDGAMTGKGFGSCTGANTLVKGTGLGLGFKNGMACRHGLRRFSAADQTTSETRKIVLQTQKEALKNRLAVIDRQLEGL